MNAFERRLLALEARQQDRKRKLTPDEQRSAAARLLTAEGLSEAEAVAQYDGIPAFLHHLMTRPNPDCTPLEGDVLEQYRLMCR